MVNLLPVSVVPERLVRLPPCKLRVLLACTVTAPLLVSAPAITPKPLIEPVLARPPPLIVPPISTVPALAMVLVVVSVAPPSISSRPFEPMVLRLEPRLTSFEVVVSSDCTVAPAPARSMVARRVEMETLSASCSVDPAPMVKVPPVRIPADRLVRLPPSRLSVWPADTASAPVLVSLAAITPKPLTVPVLARLAAVNVPPPRSKIPALEIARVDVQFLPPRTSRTPAAPMAPRVESMAISVLELVSRLWMDEPAPLRMTVASSVAMLTFWLSSMFEAPSTSRLPPVRVVPERLVSVPGWRRTFSPPPTMMAPLLVKFAGLITKPWLPPKAISIVPSLMMRSLAKLPPERAAPPLPV